MALPGATSMVIPIMEVQQIIHLVGLLSPISSTLETTKISANEVYTNFMEVRNWVSAGYIRADKIDVNELFAVNSMALVIQCAGISVNGVYFQPKTLTINGRQYTVLGYDNNNT